MKASDTNSGIKAKSSIIRSFLMLAIVFGFLSVLGSQPYAIRLASETGKLSVTADNMEKLNLVVSYEGIHTFGVSAERGLFNEILIPGAFSVGEVGTPKLPATKELIEVPFGAEVVVKVNNYTISEYKLSDFGINHPLMPVQPSLRKDQSPDEVPFEFDQVLYTKNEFIKHPLASVEILGVMRGMRIARLTIAPVSYNPVAGVIQVYNNLDISVQFINPDIEKTNYIKASTYSPYFASMQQALLNNPNQGYPNHPDLTSYPIKYLIVSDPMFESTLQPFIEWKTMKGFEVVIGYTNVIGNTYNQIQTWVHNQYNSATPDNPAPSFLLLVGDTPQIPTTIGSSSGKSTDLYYVSVDGDYFPEMYYGRFSATNVAQLQAQIDKTLYYEKYQFAAPSYLNKVTLIAGSDSYWNPAVGQPTIHYGTNNYFNTTNGYTDVYAYLTSYTGCYDPERIAVSFINFTAHCSQTSWSSPTLNQSMINNFVNTNQYPLAIGNCCQSSDFGYSECIGETWVRAANKGAVAYIGSAPNSYWFEDFYWAVGAFPIQGNNNGYVPTYEETTWGAYDGPFVSDYVSTSGIVFIGNLAVTEVHVQNYPTHSSPLYYWQAYNVLGDPSLVPYHTEGSLNNVAHLEILPIGLDFYEVTAEPGSYVAISKDGVLLGTALVGQTGTVSVTITPVVTSGMVDIVVTKPQYIPYMEQVPAVPLEGPFVTLNTFSINDPMGNNNGLADYGENISLNITLKNIGSDPTSGGNLMAVLTTTDAYVEVVGNNSQNFGAIPPDGVSIITDAYNLSIAGNAPNQHLSHLQLAISDNDTTWTANIYILLHAPAFSVSNNLIVDDAIGGNNNGQADPGEILNLLIPTTNAGSSAVANIVGTLTCPNPYITINNSSFTITSLDPGDTANANFSISVDANTPAGTPIFFEYEVAAGPYSAQKSYVLMVGLIYEDFESGDFSGFNWTFAGNQPWTITNVAPYEGQYSAKSGSITHNQSTQMILHYDVGSADSISFYRRVSSESGYDFLRFFINNTQMAQWAGNVAWGRVAFPVNEGLNIFKWEYMKDGNISSGDDCAWIDYIVFPAPVMCPNPSDAHASNITDVSAMLNWTAGNNEAIWDILWGIEGFNPETGGTLVENVTDNPFMLSGLVHSTSYEFYVRADCSVDGHSAWAGPAQFMTLCDIFEAPFIENFAGSSIYCWSFPQGQANWNFGNSYTPPSSISGSPNAFFSGTPQQNNYNIALVTPVIDATDVTNIRMDYVLFLNSQNSSTLEQLFVEYKPVGSNNWLLLEIFSNTGVGGGSQEFLRLEQSLIGMQGQEFQVRFRVQGINSSNIAGWGLDDVTIYGNAMAAGITISATANNVCEGTMVTFTALPVNGGSDPIFQWYVNGDETGENSPQLSYTPTNGDQVCCQLTSNMPGVTGSPVMSDILTMTIYPMPLVTWNNFLYDTICISWDPIPLTGGEPAGGTYSGSGVSGGYFNPAVAGLGIHTLTYSYTSVDNCTGTSSLEVLVDLCTFIPNEKANSSISIFPNPVSQTLFIKNHDLSNTIREIHLFDMFGRRVISLTSGLTADPVQITTGHLSTGIYMLEILSDKGRVLERIQVQ